MDSLICEYSLIDSFLPKPYPTIPIMEEAMTLFTVSRCTYMCVFTIIFKGTEVYFISRWEGFRQQRVKFNFFFGF